MTDLWLSPEQQHAWRALLSMHTQLHARLARELQAGSDLSYADFAVLVQLTDHEDDRARISELADALQWERSRLSHHIKRMEARGFLDRASCPEDGRGQYVSATPVGRAAIEQAAPEHVALVRALVFDGMSEAEMATVIRVSERVLDRLDQVPQKVT
ncbi:MAG TPA: MarR family transcriptional regulator [Intrasporangiaceae bacterium]|nr:MarR family transcriptional regulator [Intrasporangiaceae bacterium]